MTKQPMPSPLMTRQEVADYYGLPFKTLEQWAYVGKGPRFRKVGRHVRYRLSDVDEWIEQQAAGGAAVPEQRKPVRGHRNAPIHCTRTWTRGTEVRVT